MSVRVRYGRDKNHSPKNTLVTVRLEDTLFFGIARCRVDEDRPIKDVGRALASVRCEVAIDKPWNVSTKDGTLEIHKSGLLGCVDISEKEKLLSYFRDIDNVLKNQF